MTDLHWAGLLCAALLAAFGLWGWLARRPRLRASDVGDSRRMAREMRQWFDEPGDPTHERIDQALAIVDQAKALHTDQAMRRLTEDTNE